MGNKWVDNKKSGENMENLIRIKVMTTWQGKVAVRDKYLKQAQVEKRGLLIKCNGEEMELPFGTIKSRIVAKSDEAFMDRYSNTSHYLYYFDWKPDPPKQPTLGL